MSDNAATPTIPREAAEQEILRAILYLTENGGPTADVLNLCRAHAALTGTEHAPPLRTVLAPAIVHAGGSPDEVSKARRALADRWYVRTTPMGGG